MQVRYSTKHHNEVMSIMELEHILAVTCNFQQCGILTCVDSDQPVPPLFKFRDSKRYSVSSLTFIVYSCN